MILTILSNFDNFVQYTTIIFLSDYSVQYDKGYFQQFYCVLPNKFVLKAIHC